MTSYYGLVYLQLSTQLRKVLKQLQEEQALNKSLLSNQQAWQDKVRKLEEDKLTQQQVIILCNPWRDVIHNACMKVYKWPTKVQRAHQNNQKDVTPGRSCLTTCSLQITPFMQAQSL